jgi:hypothetical protein
VGGGGGGDDGGVFGGGSTEAAYATHASQTAPPKGSSNVGCVAAFR